LERWLIAAALISIITWLNIRGTRLVGLSSIVFTALVLAPFAVMLVVGLPQVSPANWLQRTATTDWPLLISILLWNTSGWDNAGCCAGAVDAPNRVYPRAMMLTLILVTAAYLLPLAVGTGVDSDWPQWKEGYLPKIAAQIGGSWLGIWLTAAALISAAGMFSALLCTSARVPYAMARRTMLPRALAATHPDYATPWRAILINSAGVALLIPFSFQELIEVDMFLYAAALLLEFAALVWLRIKRPEMPRPYRIPCGTSGVIAICIPPIGLCLLSIALSNPATKYLGLGAIVVGLLVYRWQARATPVAEIETAPIA
ncbi:MAG: APC family permease, partial [Candidatus Binatia bacterium]